MGVAYNKGYSGEGGDFFGGALGVAAGDYDLAGRVFAMDAADGGASVLIGCAGDGAGIENDEFGLFRRRCAMQSAIAELAFQGRAVGLSGAATEVFNVETGHAL